MRNSLSALSAAACWTWARGRRKSTSSPNRFLTKKKSPRRIAARCARVDTRTMKPSTEATAPAARVAEKPRIAFAIGTARGAGYLKRGPGTWGSLVGLIVAVISHPLPWFFVVSQSTHVGLGVDLPLQAGTLGIF